MSSLSSLLRLNVGFIIHENIGYSREFLFDVQNLHLPPDLELKHLSGMVRVSRTPQGLPIQVKMRAAVHCSCVRCLADFLQPLEVDFTELYAFTPRSVTDSDLIVPENGQIDLAPLVREYMLLDIPMKPLCRPDCKGLCPVCGQNRNDNTCQHQVDEIDPRLSVLKELGGNE